MIENQPKRSMEFFRHPVLAGEAARALPFKTGEIFALQMLRAIVLGLVFYFSYLRFGASLFVVDTQSASFQSLTVVEQQSLIALQRAIEQSFSSPLLDVFAYLFIGLVMSSLIWRVCSLFGDRSITWHEGQSVWLRYQLVVAAIVSLISLLALVTGSNFLRILSGFASIYCLVNFLPVMKGGFGLKSIASALSCALLSFMAFVGVMYAVRLILGVFIGA